MDMESGSDEMSPILKFRSCGAFSSDGFFIHSVAALLLVCGLVGGCQQSARTVGQSGIETDVRAIVQPSAVGLDIKNGMPYAELRDAANRGGWKPVVEPACPRNVVGDDYKDVCRDDPKLEACHICTHLPELSSCSGDGYCGMYFSKEGTRLHVVAYGDFSDWNNEGTASQFTVSGWDFSK